MTILFLASLPVAVGILCNTCFSLRAYRKDLLSDNKDLIDNACFKLGEIKDTAAVKLLLTKILDPRMSTDFRFKGMTVNYCKLSALQKISGVGKGIKLDQFKVDTLTTIFYIDWAIKSGYIKSREEVDIYFYKEGLHIKN